MALAHGRAHVADLASHSLMLLGKTGLIERKDDGLGLMSRAGCLPALTATSATDAVAC